MVNTDNLNGTVFISDNYPFLRSLDTESVDLVVIDPPFGKKQTFTGNLNPPLTDEETSMERDLMASWEVYDPSSAYEIGLEYPDQEGKTAKFSDIWDFRLVVDQEWFEGLQSRNAAAFHLIQTTRRTHSEDIAAYIAFMTMRMIEIHRALKPSGSVYLHCDNQANAYLRQMMDAVFGASNFRNEVIWAYTSPSSAKRWFPRKHDTILFYCKNDREAVFNWQDVRVPYVKLETGRTSGIFKAPATLDEGREVVEDWWSDVSPVGRIARERTGYPTQKPQALARRIILASTNPGDLVLDCFAGCSYVPVAAEQPGRRWIACDMSPRAWTIVRRQFHRQPDLRIVTEGGIPNGFEVAPDLGDKRQIRVRGPGQLPKRSNSDPMARETPPELAPPEFKQKPLESGEEIWRAFVALWGTACWYCGTTKPEDRRELQLDHIEPNRRDGTNDDCDNRALACAPCNSGKGGALSVEDTMGRALDAGRIQTAPLQQSVLREFRIRHEWAKRRKRSLDAATSQATP